MSGFLSSLPSLSQSFNAPVSLQYLLNSQKWIKTQPGNTTLLPKFTFSTRNSTIDTLLIHKSTTLPTKPKIPTSNKVERHNFVEKTTIPITQNVDYVTKGVSFRTLEDFNNLLIQLLEDNELDWAVNLFNELPCYGLSPDFETYFLVIKCYCKKNDPDGAKMVLDKMVENGFSPDGVTFTVLVNLFCKRGRVKRASEVFEVMGKVGCEPTILTYNCLISGLCYVGKVEEAYRLLKKIEKSSMRPDIYTYTAVMDGFCKVGRSDEGMELLQDALVEGLEPNVVTFNTLFDGYCREGRPLEGIGLLKGMKEKGYYPDYITYSTLLHGLLKWGETLEALKVYKEMVGSGFEVDERMMNTLLRRICRRSRIDRDLLDDVEEVLERIRKTGSSLYPRTHRLVLETLSVYGKPEKAVANLKEMLRNHYPPRLITFTTVVQALCNEARVDEALLLLVIMGEHSIVPNRICYEVLISEFNREGRVSDACGVYGTALKQGVISRRKPRKRLDEWAR